METLNSPFNHKDVHKTPSSSCYSFNVILVTGQHLPPSQSHGDNQTWCGIRLSGLCTGGVGDLSLPSIRIARLTQGPATPGTRATANLVPLICSLLCHSRWHTPLSHMVHTCHCSCGPRDKVVGCVCVCLCLWQGDIVVWRECIPQLAALNNGVTPFDGCIKEVFQLASRDFFQRTVKAKNTEELEMFVFSEGKT